MKFGTRRITLYAVLIAAALIVSVFEDRLPAAIIPVPGVKLGLSNIITLFALYFLGAIPAVVILICRCALASMFGSGITGFVFSAFGGLFAVAVMTALKPLDGKLLSIFGVSIAGAAAHGVGQILAAILILGSVTVIYYLPFLLIAAIFTGSVTAYVSKILLARPEIFRNIE